MTNRRAERRGGIRPRVWHWGRKAVAALLTALASLCAHAGGTPGFSVTVWRGETAYVEIPVGAEYAALEQENYPLDGVLLSFYYFDDVAYETKPGGKDMKSRPDVLQKRVPGPGRKVKPPTICCVSAAPDAKPGRKIFGPLEVTVVDRVLPPPVEWKYSLDLWQHPWAVARYFKVKPFSSQHLVKMRPILRTLADCGCKTLTVTLLDRPWNGQCHDAYGSMVSRRKNADGSWSFDYSKFDQYVRIGRQCGVGPDIACYTMCPWGWVATWRGADGKKRRAKLLPGTPEFEDYWGDFLVDFAAHLKAKGWFDNTYIAMDERAPEDVRKVVELVARKAPGLKVSMAGNRKPSAFKGIAIDSYSQSLKHLTRDFFKELPPRREKGLKTTVYVCCAEKRPNTFMESGPNEGFWLGAYPYMAGFDGFLRWAANSWPEDPYKDASFNTKSWRAGDTFLVYPNGEMSSRLLDLRRGVVAAEKLRILREAGAVTDAEIADVVSRYGWLGAQAGKFDYGKFRSEVESLVSKPTAPAAETEHPVDIAPVHEEPSPREEPPEYALLTRNVNRVRAAPFFEALFLPGAEALPPGGRKAVALEAHERFGGTMTPYWTDDLLSDFDPKSAHFPYRAMALRVKPSQRKEKGLDVKAMRSDAWSLYESRRAEVNPLVAADLAWSISEDVPWDTPIHELSLTNLVEDAERAVTDPAVCNSNNVEFVAVLLDEWKVSESEDLLTRLEGRAGEVDPWLMEYLRGRVMYRKAWKSRGPGYSATVTEDGWAQYGRLIREAEGHFRKAFALRPDIPASARALCRLEQPAASKAEQDAWFNAGLAACPDSYPLRFSRLFHLTSRWGGSQKEMRRELNRIAPVDGDYGTRIPAFNVSLRLRALARYEYDGRDNDTREKAFTGKNARAKTLRVIREYMKSGSSLWLESPRDRDDILCDFTSAAYSCGDYPLMVECWRRITPGIWRRRFDAGRSSDRVFAYEGQTMRTRLPFLLGQARYPKRFAALCEAYGELEDGDVTNAVAKLSAIGNAEPAGSPIRTQLAEDVWRAQYRRASEEGARVSLMDDLLSTGDPGRRGRIGWLVPQAWDAARTSFRDCDAIAWHATKGIRRDFRGVTEFTVRHFPDLRTPNAKDGRLEFYLGPASLTGEQKMPVLQIDRSCEGEWSAFVWENFGSRDMRWSIRGPMPARTLVERRPIAAHDGEVRVRIGFADGKMTIWVNGERLAPRPLDFAFDGENKWYPFNFSQRCISIVDHWLDGSAEARHDAEGESPCRDRLPPFASQERLVPLPTMDYATNATVRAAAEAGRPTFPEYAEAGPWWSVKFNSSEIEAMRPQVVEALGRSLTNEVWAAMPAGMRGPLALRFAALAHQAGELGLAAEYIVRYVPDELVEDVQALSVPDARYDNVYSDDPGGHGRDLRTRLYGSCTPLRAAWWRACRATGPTDASGVFGDIRRIPVRSENHMPEYTGFALPAAEGWRFAIKAKGPFQLWWGSSGVCATAAADGKFAVKVVENYVGKYGHVTSGEAGKDVEVECGLDGTYLVEVVNQDGRREFRAGGKPIIEFNVPTDFTPRWLLNGGNVVGATLEKLP